MSNTILQGDALSTLKTLPSESVDMCITSPPYWGLRDYGVDGQLGQEADFRDFITHLADIFDEVKRVLKPEGTCWVNLGDSYAGSGKGIGSNHGKASFSDDNIAKTDWRRLKIQSKTLMQVPSRFAIEMTDRGWILRNEIIWHKPNAMPQSVKDRFSVDFEKLFFFTKSKKYHFEQQTERGVMTSAGSAQRDTRETHGVGGGNSGINAAKARMKLELAEKGFVTRNKRSVWTIPTRAYSEAHFAVYPEALIETPILAGCPIKGTVLDPFFGSGTTGAVALRLDRKYIGIELNPEYIEIANTRIAKAQIDRIAVISTLPLEFI